MATPTPATRWVAHALVGALAAVVVKQLFHARGSLTTMAALAFGAYLHNEFDAPVARAMAQAGLQF